MLTIHAGPKRVATTLLQYLMVELLSPSDMLDGTAHEGNSHKMALTAVRMHGGGSVSIEEESKHLSNVDFENCLIEAVRLKERLSQGLSVCLSCELFAHIHPSSIESLLCPSTAVDKRVIFIRRDTDSLLRSLFSNGIAGGYRGTIKDFIDDVLKGNLHRNDIYPPICEWVKTGWNASIVPFMNGGQECFVEDVIRLITGGDINKEKLSLLLRHCNHHTVNASLSPENLFRISIFLNALNEYPSDLRDELKMIAFVNQVLMPFFRDSPYSPSDFDAKSCEQWKPFVDFIDVERMRLFNNFVA